MSQRTFSRRAVGPLSVLVAGMLPVAALAITPEQLQQGQIRICYNGSEATVSPSVVYDYLNDGATVGSCSEAASYRAQQQAAASAQSSAPSSAAASSASSSVSSEASEQEQEAVEFGLNLEALGQSPFWSQASEGAMQDDEDGASRIEIDTTTVMNGERYERHEVWVDGAPMHLEAGVNLSVPGIFGMLDF
jgi:hypothetical protein